VPGSGRLLFQGALANLNPRTVFRVDFRQNDRAPLLFIAGGSDHVIPASVNESNAAKYTASNAATAYTEFPGRSHFTLGQAGWERVADYALDWATENAPTETARRRAQVTDQTPLAVTAEGSAR
jgi:alpha-beta hydrolase superfamily lysophospholipase